jgi:hypothetical protein
MSMIGRMTSRRLLPLLLALQALLAPAVQAALPRAGAVPGGVAIVAVADAAAPRPEVRYDGRPVLTVADGGQWRAVVGLPLATKPGRAEIEVRDADGVARKVAFDVADKAYRTQSLKVAP